MLEIANPKTNLGIDLFLNASLFICQLIGKLQPFLIVFSSLSKQLDCLARIFGSFGLFEIANAKPKSGIDLLLNAILSIRLGKPYPLSKMFNGFLKQFVCFICIFGLYGLFIIATAKPRLDIDWSLNVVLFICQLLGKP